MLLFAVSISHDWYTRIYAVPPDHSRFLRDGGQDPAIYTSYFNHDKRVLKLPLGVILAFLKCDKF